MTFFFFCIVLSGTRAIPIFIPFHVFLFVDSGVVHLSPLNHQFSSLHFILYLPRLILQCLGFPLCYFGYTHQFAITLTYEMTQLFIVIRMPSVPIFLFNFVCFSALDIKVGSIQWLYTFLFLKNEMLIFISSCLP